MSRIFLLCACLLVSNEAQGQVPVITSVFPCGMQRGATYQFHIQGTNLHEPLELITSFPARASFTSPGDNPTKLEVQLTVPPDVELGWHSLRLLTKRGLSNFRVFCIDDLPQVIVSNAPYELSRAQEISIPCVVCGTMQPEQRHYYSVHLKEGQVLCAEILGRRLGSPMDPALVLYDLQSGRQLAFSDDAPGLQKDARFRFVSPRDGHYALEVRDVRYGGGNDWHYRLRLGEFPLVSTPIPLALQRGTKTTIQFAASNPEQTLSTTIVAPSDEKLLAIPVTPRLNKPGTQAGWPVSLLLSQYPEMVRNPEIKLTNLPLSTGISSQFLKEGEQHRYQLKLPKGRAFRIRANGQETGSPASVLLNLFDMQGKKLAASNPEAEYPTIDYTSPEEAEYHLTAEHLYYAGGHEQTYRLIVLPVEKTFSLSATTETIDISPDNRALIVVRADRSGGYDGAIKLEVKDTPGIQGSGTIPPGKSSSMFTLERDSSTWGQQELRIVGKGDSNQRVLLQNYSLLRPALNDLLYPPLTLDVLPRVGTTQKVPFEFHAEFSYPYAVRGLPIPVRLSIERSGYSGEVQIISRTIQDDPNQKPLIAPVDVKLSSAENNHEIKLTVHSKISDNEPVAFLASAIVEGRKVTTTSSILPIKFGPAVTVSTRETSILAKKWKTNAMPSLSMHKSAVLLQGLWSRLPIVDLSWLQESIPDSSVEVIITRHGGYPGPVQVRMINTPEGIISGTATIPAGNDRIRLPVIQQSDSRITINDVIIEAIAVDLPNEKVLSQPLTITTSHNP